MPGAMSEMHADAAWDRDPDGVVCYMYTKEVDNIEETRIRGSAWADRIPYARITVPGDEYNIVDTPLTDEHKARWPQVWESYSKKQAGLVSGTPLKELRFLLKSEVAAMHAFGIISAESLATVADSKLGMYVTREHRERARQYLQGAPETERELRRELAAVQKELAASVEREKTLADALEKAGIDLAKGRRKAA